MCTLTKPRQKPNFFQIFVPFGPLPLLNSEGTIISVISIIYPSRQLLNLISYREVIVQSRRLTASTKRNMRLRDKSFMKEEKALEGHSHNNCQCLLFHLISTFMQSFLLSIILSNLFVSKTVFRTNLQMPAFPVENKNIFAKQEMRRFFPIAFKHV